MWLAGALLSMVSRCRPIMNACAYPLPISTLPDPGIVLLCLAGVFKLQRRAPKSSMHAGWQHHAVSWDGAMRLLVKY